MNYGFFRYTDSSLPKTINDILKLIEECSFWQPEYIWFDGKFYNKTSYLEQLSDLKNPFSDFDFSQVNIVNHKEDITEYLLKIVDGASVVLKKYNTDSTPELLIPRQDLFSYSGGYAWGYSGTGVRNLSYALLSDYFEDDDLVNNFVNFLSYLDGKKEHSFTGKEVTAYLKHSP